MIYTKYKSVFEKKSKVHNNAGKQVDFKEALSVDVQLDLKNNGEGILTAIKDEVHCFIITFEDKDFFG